MLPFTLPVAKNFQYASATQANLTLERELNKNTAISIGYIYVGAHHLPHPTDLNTPQTNLQIQNFQRFFGGALPTSQQAAVAFSIASYSARHSDRRRLLRRYPRNGGHLPGRAV